MFSLLIIHHGTHCAVCYLFHESNRIDILRINEQSNQVWHLRIYAQIIYLFIYLFLSAM